VAWRCCLRRAGTQLRLRGTRGPLGATRGHSVMHKDWTLTRDEPSASQPQTFSNKELTV
jgi:hypothetical protein